MLGYMQVCPCLSSPMNTLDEPLTDTELDFLDDFLLDRIDDEADTDDQDEGVLDVSELDGMFTAIVSSPVMIPPSHWLPAVWGDFDPVWENEQAFGAVFSLLVRHMNTIADTLLTRPESFEPLFCIREASAKTHLIVDEWCHGYLRGIALADEAWAQAGEDLTILLTPIFAFTAATKWQGHDLKASEVENIQQAITPNVREIYAYWLSRRMTSVPDSHPVRRDEPKISRNDPCPCGSGKKYKRCCLH